MNRFSTIRRYLVAKNGRLRHFSSWWLVLFLAGCAVGPDYRRPAVSTSPAFRNDRVVSTNSFADLPWWQVFHDETLQGLIRTALTNNYDLRIAVTRIAQASAIARETRGQFLPQVNYAALAGKGKNVGAGNTPSPTGITGGPELRRTSMLLWEIDLWGRIRRLNESARTQLFASEEARRDVMTSVIAQVAQEYFQLLALENQLEIAEKIDQFLWPKPQGFQPASARRGVASKLETSSAEALMPHSAAAIHSRTRSPNHFDRRSNQCAAWTKS